MSYSKELRLKWRPLLAATIGYSVGYNLSLYLSSIFTPHLLRDFGWSKSQFSLVGTATIVTVVCAPLAGRLVDIFGVRLMARIGIICCPLIYIAFSLLTGNFAAFMALNVLQVILLGMLTTSVVYSRVIAENFNLARGTALGLMASSPPLVAAILAPLLSHLIDAEGWRAGYRALAVISLVGGMIALMLMPKTSARSDMCSARPQPGPVGAYRAIFSEPVFYLILAGMLFCNLTLVTNGAHLKVILLERSASSDLASWMVSLFALSIVAGRLAVGLALDRMPVHLVVAVAMALPGAGLLVLGTGVEHPVLLACAVSLMGLGTGADGDIMAYLVMRYFPVEMFSSVFGLVGAAVALASALGALFLSASLAATGKYDSFLIVTGVAAFVGGALFLLLRGRSPMAATA